MTCAHVVNVALKKVRGVETVEVGLNRNRADVKLKAGNTVTVRQLWKLLHDKGYTAKTTVIVARGEMGGGQFRTAGTGETFPLSGDSAAAGSGQTVTIRGSLEPPKDLKSPAPLRVSEVN
jgi:copper chaperone CopZ